MWKLVSRFDLWSRAAWCSYILLGCIMFTCHMPDAIEHTIQQRG